MSRTRLFLAGAISGYGSIAANILFTLISVPLALSYLDREQFGLWALAVQIYGYLSLLELGTSNAISRFMADHKDDVNGGLYAQHLVAGGIVFVTQGIIITLSGLTLSFIAPLLFDIPTHLRHEFKILILLLSLNSFFSIPLRFLASPLYPFQRLDIINYSNTVGTITSLLCLWLLFDSGLGLYAFPVAQLPSTLGIPLFGMWICIRNRYYPKKDCWLKPIWAQFKKIFYYGKDVLLMQIGNQLINASQIIIISRMIGLEAAAIYSISTKIYNMAGLFLAIPMSSSGPALTELYVRGDYTRFIKRHWHIMFLTLAAASIIACGISTGNRIFVDLWTKNTIKWPWICDSMLAILIILRANNTGFTNLSGTTKNLKIVRFIYLVEGITFIPLGVFFTKHYGIQGTIFAALVAHLLVTTPLSFYYAKPIIGISSHLSKSLLVSIFIVALGSIINYVSFKYSFSFLMSFLISTILIIISIIATYKIIIPTDLKKEFLTKLEK